MPPYPEFLHRVRNQDAMWPQGTLMRIRMTLSGLFISIQLQKQISTTSVAAPRVCESPGLVLAGKIIRLLPLCGADGRRSVCHRDSGHPKRHRGAMPRAQQIHASPRALQPGFQAWVKCPTAQGGRWWPGTRPRCGATSVAGRAAADPDCFQGS